MNKILIIFTCFVCSLSLTFSSSLQISEVNFRGDEFVEIILENASIVDTFNQSYFVIDDENTQNNTFSLKQHQPNSSMLLIVGSNFIEKYEDNQSLDLSNLNCQIYETSGSEVGFNGLNVGGEVFTIYFNSNLTLNYSNQYITPGNEGNSLHFNSTSHFIDQNSPCELHQFQNTSTLFAQNNTSETSNSTNGTNTTTPSNTNSCDLSLSLDVNTIVEKEKISFSFSGNLSSGVTYRVEDGVGNIVKDPFTSSTTSSKSYTPKKNGKFIIYGEVGKNNCSTQVNQSTFFYNSQLDEDNEGSSSSSVRVKRDTFIEIHQVIQSGYNQVKLIGEASRGDSSSYRMSVNVDDERVAEFDVGKYGNFDFQIPLQLTPGEHEIEVRGFGERDEVDVEIADVMGELEERMITLSQMQSTTNEQVMLDDEQIRKFIQSNDSVQNQRTSQQSEKISNDVNLTQVLNSTNEKNTSTQTIFSKHFFSQNVGLLTMIGAVVLIAGAIIALR